MEEILDFPSSNTQRRLNYAGFWIRVGASIVDGIILWIVNTIISYAAFGSPFGQTDISIVLTSSGISLLVNIGYFVIMESSEKQATIGKMLLKLKVGKANGDRISFLNALGRYFAKFISFIIFLIGYLMVAWDPKKQGLHDKIADTYVFEG